MTLKEPPLYCIFSVEISQTAGGMLRVISNKELDEQAAAREAQAVEPERDWSDLAAYVRSEFEMMRNHRSSATGWNDRLLKAQRCFNGEYDPEQLFEIRKFGGSEVYARLIAVKCRGATALLRDVYLSAQRSWGLEATPEPSLPEDIAMEAERLVRLEVEMAVQQGVMPEPEQIRDRLMQLINAARLATKKKAREEALKAQDALDDILVEGGFYKALAEFLVDVAYFPFAVMKGPVVRVVPQVTWQDGTAVIMQTPKLFWNRISPFDIYFTPGVSDIEDAAIIEKVAFTRADLNDIIDLPGYNKDAIMAVLDEHGRGGLYDFLDPTDAERAEAESRENPHINRSGLIHGVEYHGNVQGRMLLDLGFTEDEIPDPMRDYHVQTWQIGRHTIKAQLSPSPRKRHPYFLTSFEKVPGTIVGNALPDILEDVQQVANATLRALVNNMSIASGPQVVVNDDRLAPGEDGDELFPWKRWHVSNDPLGNNAQIPVNFFQPNSNAQELLVIYEKLTQIADETSAIPRYITGSERMGGAGRTASGLAMLMGNASKILQTVSANIDRDIFEPALQALYDMVMLSGQGMLRGDEQIRVRGVDIAIQRETDRARQLELLQITANPVDMQIMGPKGRAALLRSVSSQVGLEGEPIIPTEDQLDAMLAAASAAPPGGAPRAPGAPGGGPSAPGQPPQIPQGGASGPPPADMSPGQQQRRDMSGVA